MIQFNVYPGGKKRVLTFSFDDGDKEDERLTQLLNKYGLKATFCLNGAEFAGRHDEYAVLRKRYSGHEIACHSLYHGRLTYMSPTSIINEVFEERKILEEIAEYPVCGFSYPCGSSNEISQQVLSSCGFLYARKASSAGFEVPENFYLWKPTCHFRKCDEHLKYFTERIDSVWEEPVFFMWGHGHDMHSETDWEETERMFKSLSGNPKIWYATNIEICNYVRAQRALVSSADERILYNPTATDVWVERNKEKIICIPAGKTVRAY